MKCDKCSEKKAITLTYGPHHFCETHFTEFFEKRFRKCIRVNKLIGKNEKIAVGVSGGKDSVVLLNLLADTLPKRNKIIGVSIDEGIKGYREIAIKEAKKNYKELGIDFIEASYEERFGTNMVEIVRKSLQEKVKNKSCSFCGVLRRRLLNDVALEQEADKLATGHNLDDEVQSICMNFFENDLSRLSRLGVIAGTKKIKGLVPRIKPLYTTPEQEIIVYANMKKFPHYSDKCCPFSHQAKRNHYRKFLNELELQLPGTKYSILSSFQNLKPSLKRFEKKGKFFSCKKCGAVSSSELCQSCKLLDKIPNNKKQN